MALLTFQSGEDEYIIGCRENTQGKLVIAKLWKNYVSMLTNSYITAQARSVFVEGDDVYVAGNEKIAQKKVVVKLWKNGIVQNWTDGKYDAFAFGVFVKAKQN